MTLILRGDRETIPPHILKDVIAGARSGNEPLIVVDEDEGLPAALADPDIDLLIDPARGNWDFFADHDGDRDMARAAEAMTAGTDVPPASLALATRIIEEILHDVARYPRPDLAELSARFRTFDLNDAIVWMRVLGLPDDGDRDRTAWTVRAILHANAGGFARCDPRMPPVEIRRWFAGDPRRILFIAAGDPHGACRSVAAAIACIVAHEADRGRIVATEAYRGNDDPSLPAPWEIGALPEPALAGQGSC